MNFTNLVFFTFPYQQALAQLDKHKASLWYLDKGSTENQNIDKLNHIGFKNCSSNAMEQSNTSTNRKTNWRFCQEQAQADINRFVGYLKHYEDVKCQIRFLKRCIKSRMVSEALWPQWNIHQNPVFVFAEGFSFDCYEGHSGINMNYCRRLITKFEYMIGTLDLFILGPDFITISILIPENLQWRFSTNVREIYVRSFTI